MIAAKRSLQSQLIIFVISLSNDLDNKEEHGNAHAVFQMSASFYSNWETGCSTSVPGSGKGKQAAAQVASGDYGADKARIQQNPPWLMTSGFLLTFDPFWFGQEQKSLFTRAPHRYI